MLANSIMDSMGLNKSQSILSQHTAPKLSNRRSEEMPTSASSYNTRTKLGKEPLSGEFDLVITQVFIQNFIQFSPLIYIYIFYSSFRMN